MFLEVRHDEKLIAQLFGTQPDSVVWFTPVFAQPETTEKSLVIDFTARYCNQAACKILNASPGQIVGKNLLSFDLMDQESLGTIFEQCLQVWNTGQSIEFSYFSAGLNKYFNVQRSKVMDGILSITRDRTEIMKAEKERENQAILLDQILNSSVNGLYTLKAVRDKGGKITDFKFVHANDIFCKVVKRSKTELLSHTYLELYPHTIETGIFDRNCRVITTGIPTREEVHYKREEIDVWVDTAVTKLNDDMIVVAFNEISELKNYAEQLKASNAELKKSNERLSEFTHIASHDLHEPLRKIMTFAQLLNERYASALDFGAKDYLFRISRTAKRMQVLIDDLLSYSRVANAIQKFEKLSLDRIVSEVVADLETVISESHAKITISPLPDVIGDYTQITQVFQNLISNALKFQKDDTAPIVNIVQEDDVEKNNMRYTVISVSDNGIGFEMEHSDKIFQLFQRLHGKNEFEGTGIGLAIVQKAMENHRSWVEADSEPGKGSTFRLLFAKQ